MRYAWLFVLLIAVLSAIALLTYFRGARGTAPSVAWLANTERMRLLPSYQQELRRSKTSAIALVSVLTILTISLSTLAGAPVDRREEHPKLASRDIVLCLDASGSMLPYDGQILRQFKELVEGFQGERLSLHAWSAQTVVMFPLTDDYDLIAEVLTEAARIIDTGYLGEEGDYVLVSQELAEYLEGVEAPDGAQISSLVGDGLATCVLGFDQRDQARSRTILLATDNEVMGEQIYSFQEAAEFASKEGIEIIALYPGTGGVISAEGEQMRYIIEQNGGSFYNASDPGAIAQIIGEIEAQQLADLESSPTVTETDRPESALRWAMWSLFGLLVIGAVRRL